jgi:hypothetical protein
VKGRRRDHILHGGKGGRQGGYIEQRGAVVAIMHVQRPSAGRSIGSQLQHGPVEIVSRNSRVGASAGHEEENVDGVGSNHAIVFAMVDGTSRHCGTKRLRFGPQPRRQRGNVAFEDAGVGFESLDIDRPSQQSAEIVREKTRSRGERADGDEPVMMLRVGVDLMRGSQAAQRILVGRRSGHRADRAVLDQLEHVVVERRMGIGGHGGTQRPDRVNTRPFPSTNGRIFFSAGWRLAPELVSSAFHMPSQANAPRSRRPGARRFDPWHDPGAVLVVIDEAPLKHAAWAELHAVRKRQEKAARDLHRHEDIDRPAFDSWLHRTFPTLITRLRELHEEVFAKSQKVEAVQYVAMMTGRSPRKIWREHREQEKNPAAAESSGDEADGNERYDREARDGFEDDAEGTADEAGYNWEWNDNRPRDYERPAGPRAGAAARDVYRRLVQRIHPDRGGPWTAARQRLWHEVQQAWAAGDADWLMRLEIEWEAANDVLSPSSPLSRLRAAIEELHAARRDLERKLRSYRETPQWRFTLAEKKRDELHRRTKLNFDHDLAFLQRQLDHLNALIAGWERPPTRRGKKSRPIEIRFFE